MAKRYEGDFLEKLANDREYQSMMREKESRKAAFEAELSRDEENLVQELKDTGVQIALEPKPWELDGYEGPPRSVWDLVNTKSSYPEAVQILVNHLNHKHHSRIKEGIVRSLIVSESQGIATESLIDEFRKINNPPENTPEFELKWLLGMAIAEAATLESMLAIIELVTDKNHGRAREYLPLGLRFLSKEDAKTILEPLLNDPDVHDRTVKTLKMISKRK